MNKKLLFLIPFFFECITSFFALSIPYVAMNLDANQAQIGLISTIFIIAQLPIFFIIGKLVNKFGKYPMIYTGALIITLFIVFTGYSPKLYILTILSSLGFLGHAIFYPSLQALMGDYSNSEERPKNVGIYNMGWCFGSAFVGISRSYIVEIFGNINSLLYAGCICGIICMVLVTVNYFMHKNKVKVSMGEWDEADEPAPRNNNVYLTIGRLGLFIGFVSHGAYNYILPKLLREKGWADPLILQVTGMFLVGQAIGVILCAFWKFWKERIYPQVLANLVFLITAIIVILLLQTDIITNIFSDTNILLSILFLLCGFAMAVCYTMALFHAVSSEKKERPKNTGFHEGVVAGGEVTACIVGSIGGKLFDITSIAPLKNLCFYFIIGWVILNFILYTYLKYNKLK
ncbi:MAG: MFS transporter [Abditibacteriota bacterium]|nr:MFS transporter [Abditibacteriota bacterium]